MLAGGELAENPAESSKAPVQSAFASDADSSSADREDSAGPCFDSSSSSSSSSSGGSEKEDSDDFVEEVPAPAGNPKANDGGSGAVDAAQPLPVRRPKPIGR